MKWNWIYGVVFAGALTIPAPAQISVYIGQPPPRVRYERHGPVPGPGYAWVNGYWSPEGDRYEWVPGRWDRPPYQGARWVRPRYEHHRHKGWKVRKGHWDRDEHGRHRDH
jgi:WXXGXW repeat (2 copies)